MFKTSFKRDPEVYKILGKPVRDVELSYSVYAANVERYYYWFLDAFKEEGEYEIEKIDDSYFTSPTSSYWGVIEQRRSMQQEKLSQFLAVIGNMIKSLFQLVRELRIMDERLQYYKQSKAGDKAAEIALKGLWIDLVEGGAKNPASVYSMATQVGFTILPDLFFDVTVKSSKDIDAAVERLKEHGINRKVREVLARKLKQFYLWKENTEKEINQRRKFVLKYLRQHFNVIKLYTTWVAPYIKNIKSLEQRYKGKDYEIIMGSDTAVIELEIFGVKEKDSRMALQFEKFFPCIRLQMHFRTSPETVYQHDYQRGAIHIGKFEMLGEAFVCTKEQVENYRKKRDFDVIELLSSINASMEALKDDLIKYLEEAGEDVSELRGKKKKEEKKLAGPLAVLELFFAIPKGFGELFKPLLKISSRSKEKKKKERLTLDDLHEKELAKKIAGDNLWKTYDNFKKAFGLIRWG